MSTNVNIAGAATALHGATSPTDTAVEAPTTTTEATAAPAPSAAAPRVKQPDMAALMDERIAAALAPLMERLAPQVEPAKVSDPVAAAELAALRKELAGERRRAAEDKRQAYEASAYASCKAKLADRVRPEALEVAADYFFHARKAVSVDERGNVAATWDGAAYESLDDAILAFLSGKQAAVFLPAPKAAAPGNQRPVAPSFSSAARAPSPIATTVAERLAQLRAMGFDPA